MSFQGQEVKSQCRTDGNKGKAAYYVWYWPLLTETEFWCLYVRCTVTAASLRDAVICRRNCRPTVYVWEKTRRMATANKTCVSGKN